MFSYVFDVNITGFRLHIRSLNPKGGALKGGALKGGALKGGALKGGAPKGGNFKGGDFKVSKSYFYIIAFDLTFLGLSNLRVYVSEGYSSERYTIS
jgi:hypothetical protein